MQFAMCALFWGASLHDATERSRGLAQTTRHLGEVAETHQTCLCPFDCRTLFGKCLLSVLTAVVVSDGEMA